MRRIRSVVHVLVAVLFAACSEVAPSGPVASSTITQQVVDHPSEVAKELARVLEEETTRRSIRDLLRASRQEHFAADPSSLFDGRGVIAEGLRGRFRAKGLDLSEFLSEVRGLEILMPSEYQRRRWTPEEEVFVAVAPEDRALAMVAYGPSGTERTIPITGVPEVNLLLLRPFRSLQKARGRSPLEDPDRETIEDPNVPIIMMIGDDCTPEISQQPGGPLLSDCDPPPGPCVECDEWSIEPDVLCAPDATFQSTPFNDLDSDGVRDYCEEHLARTFEPIIEFAWGENWSLREPKFAAIRSNPWSSGISIMYLLSYYEDGGYAGGAFSHAGDSEFIIVEIGPDGPNWRPWRVFTSAHYGSPDPRSEWNLITRFPTATAPHPLVYASKGKHANYAETGDCQLVETCGGGWQQYAMLGEWVNIGSLSHPFDIDPAVTFSGPSCASSGGSGTGWLECYRTSADFTGWQGGTGTTSTAYKHLLNDFGF